jgi:hypothetical protein
MLLSMNEILFKASFPSGAEFWLPSTHATDIWTMESGVGMDECVRTESTASAKKEEILIDSSSTLDIRDGVGRQANGWTCGTGMQDERGPWYRWLLLISN